VRHIAWYEQFDPSEAGSLGGKNASLVTMTAAGLPVPPGFAVTAEAYCKVLADCRVDSALDDLLATVDPDSSASVSAAGSAARELVLGIDMPAWLVDPLVEAYAELGSRCGTTDVPVAVRSSATCEDQPDASFAGEHDTYLWVRGADAVVEHVLRCWSSLFTDRAICYRRQMGYADHGAAMSVGVQKMVLPKAAGVAFTLNPLDGDRSQIAIDASWGFGEAVVSGSVTPDNYLVDKVVGSITRRTVSSKTVEHRLGDDDRVIEAEVEPERRDAPCLTDADIAAVAKLARRAEKHYRCPQDVEWALDSQLPDGENVLLLQSRPETVWSRRVRATDRRSADPITSIVQTLLDPHHGRTHSVG
jgi:pyruvate,water dikinase